MHCLQFWRSAAGTYASGGPEPHSQIYLPKSQSCIWVSISSSAAINATSIEFTCSAGFMAPPSIITRACCSADRLTTASLWTCCQTQPSRKIKHTHSCIHGGFWLCLRPVSKARRHSNALDTHESICRSASPSPSGQGDKGQAAAAQLPDWGRPGPSQTC